MLVEAAWSSLVHQARYAHSSSGSGTHGANMSLRWQRAQAAVIIWHILSKDEDYTWNRPHSCMEAPKNSSSKPVIRLAAAVARKDPRRYSNKSVRDSERETIANAEDEYRRFVAPGNSNRQRALGRHKGGATIIGCATGLAPRPCSFATWSPEPP